MVTGIPAGVPGMTRTRTRRYPYPFNPSPVHWRVNGSGYGSRVSRELRGSVGMVGRVGPGCTTGDAPSSLIVPRVRTPQGQLTWAPSTRGILRHRTHPGRVSWMCPVDPCRQGGLWRKTTTTSSSSSSSSCRRRRCFVTVV